MFCELADLCCGFFSRSMLANSTIFALAMRVRFNSIVTHIAHMYMMLDNNADDVGDDDDDE